MNTLTTRGCAPLPRPPSPGVGETLGRALLRGYLRTRGVRAVVVTDPSERGRVNELRRRLYASAGYAADLTELSERYDPHSLCIAAYAGDTMIATLRLINATPSCRVLDLWNVTLPAGVRPEHVQELSGLAIDRAHRGRGRAALLAMLDAGIQEARARDVHWWLASTQPRTFRNFVKIAERYTELTPGPPTPDHLARRQEYGDYFRGHGKTIRLVLFDMRVLSYPRNFARSLGQYLHRRVTR